jgi:hypothetical protein
VNAGDKVRVGGKVVTVLRTVLCHEGDDCQRGGVEVEFKHPTTGEHGWTHAVDAVKV